MNKSHILYPPFQGKMLVSKAITLSQLVKCQELFQHVELFESSSSSPMIAGNKLVIDEHTVYGKVMEDVMNGWGVSAAINM